MQQAQDWLTSFLREGPRLSDDVYANGDAKEGFSKKTLRRAAKALEVNIHQKGKSWWWELKDDGSDDPFNPEPATPQADLPLGGIPNADHTTK